MKLKKSKNGMKATQYAPNCLISKYWKHAHGNEEHEQAHLASSSSHRYAMVEGAFAKKVIFIFFFSSRLVFLLLCFMYFSFSPFTECGLHKCKGSCPPPLLVRNFTICRLQLTINFCLLWEGSFNQAAHCELNPFLLSQENNPSRLQW